jgi:hypothetical protein
MLACGLFTVDTVLLRRLGWSNKPETWPSSSPSELSRSSSPHRVLSGQSNHQPYRADRDGRPPWGFRVGPPSADQVPMPTEQRVRLHEDPMALRPIEQSAETGEECTICLAAGPDGQPGGEEPRPHA